MAEHPKNIQYIYHDDFDIPSANQKFNNSYSHLPKPFGPAIKFTREQERELFLKYNYTKYRASKLSEKYIKRRDKWLAKSLYYKEIITWHNIPLTIYWVNRYNSEHLDAEDLNSESLFALNNAIDKFNVHFGWKFSTYASSAIMKRLWRAIKIQNKHKSMGSMPCNERSYNDVRYNAIDAKIDIDSIVFNNNDLNDNEKSIIDKRFGLSGLPMAAKDIANMLGVSKQRVFQIEKQILEKINKSR